MHDSHDERGDSRKRVQSRPRAFGDDPCRLHGRSDAGVSLRRTHNLWKCVEPPAAEPHQENLTVSSKRPLLILSFVAGGAFLR
jgi:hypothetical protein